ncbi:MAG: DUF3313 family protein [Hyphomonadaceae bacterium]
MRLAAAVSALVLIFATAAAADPVALAPISFSPEFQTEVDETLGAREGDYLRRDVERQVVRALQRRGVTVEANAPVTIEVSVVDAEPNRPTLEQATHQPGLDIFRSVSVGGAELHAVLRGAGGEALVEVDHSYYTNSLGELWGSPSTWTDANRSISRFANKVADAYVALTVNR